MAPTIPTSLGEEVQGYYINEGFTAADTWEVKIYYDDSVQALPTVEITLETFTELSSGLWEQNDIDLSLDAHTGHELHDGSITFDMDPHAKDHGVELPISPGQQSNRFLKFKLVGGVNTGGVVKGVYEFDLVIGSKTYKFVPASPVKGQQPGPTTPTGVPSQCAYNLALTPQSSVNGPPCTSKTQVPPSLFITQNISPPSSYPGTPPSGGGMSGGSTPSTPGKKKKDPPGENVMLVVLLLGAVLALSQCMPCQ